MILLRILKIEHPQDLQKPVLRKLCSYYRSRLFYLGCEANIRQQLDLLTPTVH